MPVVRFLQNPSGDVEPARPLFLADDAATEGAVAELCAIREHGCDRDQVHKLIDKAHESWEKDSIAQSIILGF